MQLDGMHHITMITGDAQRNVDFYADLLGLRLVKKTVNFDAPEAYHLYFGDERGSPGSLLTWFEFAGATPGRAGAGMIHTIQLGVAGESSLDFWDTRLGGCRLLERPLGGIAALRSTTTDSDSSSSSPIRATRRFGPATRRFRRNTRSSVSREPARTSAARSRPTPGC